MAKSFGRHSALAWFPIADSDKEKPQQIGWVVQL
jgi:hypothetical protein